MTLILVFSLTRASVTSASLLHSTLVICLVAKFNCVSKDVDSVLNSLPSHDNIDFSCQTKRFKPFRQIWFLPMALVRKYIFLFKTMHVRSIVHQKKSHKRLFDFLNGKFWIISTFHCKKGKGLFDIKKCPIMIYIRDGQGFQSLLPKAFWLLEWVLKTSYTPLKAGSKIPSSWI